MSTAVFDAGVECVAPIISPSKVILSPFPAPAVFVVSVSMVI
jgi:hypothetical protein